MSKRDFPLSYHKGTKQWKRKVLGTVRYFGTDTLVRSDVTDAGLQHLQGLKNLEWLDVSGTKVTESGAKQFAESRPKCKVELYRNAKPRR